MENFRSRLMASTLLVGINLLSSPTLAQDPAAEAPTGPVESQPTPDVSSEGEDVQTGGDIIVTGSRIPQPNLESAAPVTVVSDQDVKLSGSTRIEDVLNQLPSVGAAQASGVSNGAPISVSSTVSACDPNNVASDARPLAMQAARLR